MALKIGIVNQKGGVGKTTTSVNLAHALAVEQGQRVLLIDLDPQGNCTTHLGVSNMHEENEDELILSLYDVLKGNIDIRSAIIERSPRLHVLPSSLMLSAADLELGGVVGRELLLKRAIRSIEGDFDYILIDCPPALGLLSLNALAAIDKVVIPVQSEYLALHGVRQLLDTIEQVKTIYNPELEVGGVLICLHDSRKRLARSIFDIIKSYFGDLVFDTVIRSNVALAEAPSEGQAILEYSPKSSGSEDYSNLAQEIVATRLERKQGKAKSVNEAVNSKS